jgi:putative ABC transport system permease protein
MGLITRLSWRNLLRQKKRNLFLGICIGFGMMILVMANSFSHGMVDVLINEIVSYAFGHLVIDGTEGNNYYTMIRDKERMIQRIEETVGPEDLLEINENLGMMARAIGNGEADTVMVIGVTIKEEEKHFLNDFFTLIDGDFNEYFSDEYEYPVIVSAEMAKSLNVGIHDVVHVRIPMVTGQVQSAKLTVIAIANASNTFMNIVVFMDGSRVKELIGYKPWESASLQLTLRDPLKTATYYAELLHEKLTPDLLGISGQINDFNCQLLAFQNNDQAKEFLKTNLTLIDGDEEEAWGKQGVMLSRQLARKAGLGVGSEFKFVYPTKYRGLHEVTLKVDAIYDSATALGTDVLFVNEERIHSTYQSYLPEKRPDLLAEDDQLSTALATEWKLLRRSKDSQELQLLLKEERKIKTAQSKINVITMYEGASDILKLESALNLLTMFAVLVLFFIILIGVVNTLRMTIKERTREIGTMRAMGMQKRDVRNVFIMEVLFLTILSCGAGVLLGLLLQEILSQITFETTSGLSMILKDGHLFFKPSVTSILRNYLVIMLIAGITAYFPARRAAKLSAVEALRHYE